MLHMPNKANAKKALRQAKKRALQNAQVQKAYKLAVKTAKKAIAAGRDAAELIKTAQKKLDKAAQKKVLERGTAARIISRLTKQASKVVKK